MYFIIIHIMQGVPTMITSAGGQITSSGFLGTIYREGKTIKGTLSIKNIPTMNY